MELLLVNNNVAGMSLLLDTCKVWLGLHSKTATASWREASVDRKLLVVELHSTYWLKFHLYMDKVVAASHTGLHLHSEKSQSASCKWGCQECHMSSMLRTSLVWSKSSFLKALLAIDSGCTGISFLHGCFPFRHILSIGARTTFVL